MPSDSKDLDFDCGSTYNIDFFATSFTTEAHEIRVPTPRDIRYPYGLSIEHTFCLNTHYRDLFDKRARLLRGALTHGDSSGADISRVQYPFLIGEWLVPAMWEGGTEGGMHRLPV